MRYALCMQTLKNMQNIWQTASDEQKPTAIVRYNTRRFIKENFGFINQNVPTHAIAKQ